MSECGGAERHSLGHPAPMALGKREVGGLKEIGMQCVDRQFGTRQSVVCVSCVRDVSC